MSPPPDDFRQLQDHLRRVVGELHILLKEFQDFQHKFLDILHSSGSNKITLPVNEDILEPDRTVWHTTTTCVPTLKRVG